VPAAAKVGGVELEGAALGGVVAGNAPHVIGL
jgi:hypothetical protein